MSVHEVDTFDFAIKNRKVCISGTYLVIAELPPLKNISESKRFLLTDGVREAEISEWVTHESRLQMATVGDTFDFLNIFVDYSVPEYSIGSCYLRFTAASAILKGSFKIELPIGTIPQVLHCIGAKERRAFRVRFLKINKISDVIW